MTERINQLDDATRISSFFGSVQGPLLKKMVEGIDWSALTAKITGDIWAISATSAALANTVPKTARELIRKKLRTSHIKGLIKKIDDAPFPLKEYGRCYGMIAIADEEIADELVNIIRSKLKELSASLDRSVSEIPTEPSPLLAEIMEVIHEVVEMQALFGRHHSVVEKLLNALEGMIKDEMKQAKASFVDFSGEDISEEEALKEISEGIKEEFQELLFGWDEEFIKRIITRFNLT